MVDANATPVASPTASPASSLAERKRLLVRDELADAAARILAVRGFDETTVDHIVAAAGVSRRTFFRYFESKEDVIVHMLAGAGEHICDALRTRPADEPTAAALRHALTPIISFSVADPDKALHTSRLIFNTPALLARFLERQTRWQADIAAILGHRAGLDPCTDLRPTLAAGIALTAFNTALRCWATNDNNQPLATVIDDAFAFVAPALHLASRPADQ